MLHPRKFRPDDPGTLRACDDEHGFWFDEKRSRATVQPGRFFIACGLTVAFFCLMAALALASMETRP